MTTKLIEHPCGERVYPRETWGSLHGHNCGKPAKVKVNSKWYCGIHNPIKRAERQKERDKAYHDKRKRESEEFDRRIAERHYCQNLTTEYMESHQAEEIK